MVEGGSSKCPACASFLLVVLRFGNHNLGLMIKKQEQENKIKGGKERGEL